MAKCLKGFTEPEEIPPHVILIAGLFFIVAMLIFNSDKLINKTEEKQMKNHEFYEEVVRNG